MTTFAYRGLDQTGRGARGMVEALDPKDAREKLARRGVLVEKLGPAGIEDRRFGRRRSGLFGTDVRAMVYRELSSLLAAGLPLAQALEVLIAAPELGDNQLLLAGVRDRVREGESLAGALVAASRRVSAFEQAAVQVGERAGSLAAVLDQVAGFLEGQQAMAERVGTALIYPAAVVVLAAGIGTAVLGLMVPRVGEILVAADVPLPVLTRVMLFVSRGFVVSAAPLALLVVAGVWLARRRAAADATFRQRLDALLYRVPAAGRAYAALVNFRFARTLALLLRSGVPLLDGLGLAARATGSAWVGHLVDREAESVRQGRSLADALRRVGPLQSALPAWVEAGEASGDLPGMLESAGLRCRRQWERTTGRFLAALEPALVIAVGLFVLLVALSVLLPILAMNQTLF